jgi:hypothetical protein
VFCACVLLCVWVCVCVCVCVCTGGGCLPGSATIVCFTFIKPKQKNLHCHALSVVCGVSLIRDVSIPFHDSCYRYAEVTPPRVTFSPQKQSPVHFTGNMTLMCSAVLVNVEFRVENSYTCALGILSFYITRLTAPLDLAMSPEDANL